MKITSRYTVIKRIYPHKDIFIDDSGRRYMPDRKLIQRIHEVSTEGALAWVTTEKNRAGFIKLDIEGYDIDTALLNMCDMDKLAISNTTDDSEVIWVTNQFFNNDRKFNLYLDKLPTASRVIYSNPKEYRYRLDILIKYLKQLRKD